MRTLHLYLLRQVLATLIMTVLVLTFVLLLGNVLKEIMALLVNRQITFPVLFKAVAMLIPFVLVFALPIGMLMATLLVFGRFSADQELTAVRASGISLVALVTPILLLSVAMSGLAGLMNMEIGPKARIAYKDLIHEIGIAKPQGLLRENEYIHDIPGGYTVYVGKMRGEELEGVEVYQSSGEDKPQRWYKAPRATLTYDTNTSQITMVLYNAYGADRVGPGEWQPVPELGEVSFTMDAKPPSVTKKPLKLGDMTFRQLTAELVSLQARGIEDVTPVLVQMHRQLSFSFASIGFTLLGIPLAIRAHRRETSAGAAVALVLVLVYYSFIILGQSLENKPELAPHLILWIPNFLFQIAGAWLLWNADRRR